MSAGSEFRQPLAERWRLRLGGFGYRTEYSNGAFDDMFGRVYAGPQLLYPRGDASLLAVFDKRWYGNEPYFERWGPRIEASYGLTQRLRLQADAEYLETAYQSDRGFMNGQEFSLGIGPSVALSPSVYLRLIARYGRERTEKPYLDNDSYRVGVGYHQEMPFGITCSPTSPSTTTET